MGWDGGRDLMILGEKNDYSIKIRRGSETERKKKKPNLSLLRET